MATKNTIRIVATKASTIIPIIFVSYWELLLTILPVLLFTDPDVEFVEAVAEAVKLHTSSKSHLSQPATAQLTHAPYMTLTVLPTGH